MKIERVYEEPDYLMALAEAILLAAEEPVHLDVLVATLHQLEPEDWPGDRQDAHWLYHRVVSSINRLGQLSPFRRAGRGSFSHAAVHDPAWTPRPNDSHPRTDKGWGRAVKRDQRDRDRYLPRICANCDSVEWSGIEELNLQVGTCGRWADSGYLAVPRYHTCPLWSARSLAKRHLDLAIREKLWTIVYDFNEDVHKIGRKLDRERRR